MKTQKKILKNMERVTKLLIKKNKAYGDSATNPKNVFAKGDAVDNIAARIDDKLMRIQNSGISPEIYDTIDDLMGYLCLLKIAIDEREKK